VTNNLRNASWCVVILVATLVLVYALFRRHQRSQATEYLSYLSPDRRFKLVIYRLPMAFAMPGQGSDAPGIVRLYDLKHGRLIQEQDVEMVQMIDQFEWSQTNLHIRLFADWKLPE
jgi:hypothetical protein